MKNENGKEKGGGGKKREKCKEQREPFTNGGS
jgi:hypothetical protein